jgi:hypothetical protein
MTDSARPDTRDSLTVEHTFAPGDDTDDRVRRAISILLASGEEKREGEAA